jgi:mycobactin peptide synthetase MbtE
MSVEKERIIDRLWLHAAIAGPAPAVEDGARSVTYARLVELVDARCVELSALVGPGVLVAVERHRSIELVVDLLAVLALGGIVVPVDPELPEPRREALLARVAPEVSLRGPTPAVLARSADAPVAGPRALSDGAYVFCTSGSTGVPRPVLGSAAALRSFLDWQSAEYGLGSGERVAFLTPLSSDVAVRDVFLPLWVGATLVIPGPGEADSPETTVSWLADRRISVVDAVPSVARGWLRHGRTRCGSLRAVFFAGEVLTTDLLAGWAAVFPGTRVLVNFYGTTETALPTVAKRLTGAGGAGAVPVGRPLPGTGYCLLEPGRPLDAELVRSSMGAPSGTGEIVLVSRYASHGYLGMPAETAARFVDLGAGVTAYRTGDLGRVDEHGDLVVVGRTDDEVKVDGVRLHPAEVAAGLRAIDPVGDAFVLATGSARGPRLTAFVVPAPGSTLDPTGLRSRLAAVLPAALVPARVVEVAELPRLPGGKVDRAALQARAAAPDRARGPFRDPVGPVERRLAELWAELLGDGPVSVTDDFFARGGDWPTALQLASRIRRDHGVAMSAREVLAVSTVRALAAEIAGRTALVAPR